jgi:hypothetical protein
MPGTSTELLARGRDGPLDTQLPAVEVEVVPLEGESLSDTEAGPRRYEEER